MPAAFNDLLAFLLPLAGGMLLAYGLWQVAADLRRPEHRRITDRLSDRSNRAHQKDPAESIVRRKTLPQSALSHALARLSFVAWLQRALDQACIEWTAATLLLNAVACALGTGILVYVLGQSVWVCAVLGLLVFVAPLLFVHIKRKMRLSRMLQQLPEVFDLMSQGLRAGHSLQTAIQLVSQQLPDPAATEFGIVFHEQNFGVKVEDALKNMAERLDMMDVRFFVTAVLIQRSTGGDLAETLENIGSVIRERIKLFGQVKALTAEGRLSGWVLFALPFCVFGMEQVVNPEYGRVLIVEPVGNYCMIGACVMQLLGLAMIQKIVNIKV